MQSSRHIAKPMLAAAADKLQEMILRRLGNKQAIAQDIIKYFPAHKIYVEPFFGAGGMFFQKPKAKFNMVNDIDKDVFCLFTTILNEKEELENLYYKTPIHSDLLEYWKNKTEEEPYIVTGKQIGRAHV